ncbi:MAG: hypothetical protein FWF53_10165 [Candidatus Azobacteroides sp.]|nr:hypothetical protein [Candidatus Azobacteroides sp.]
MKNIFLTLCHPLVGWWVGKAEKWRSPFLGVDWRCGMSAANTARANFSAVFDKQSRPITPNCPILQNFQPYFLQSRTAARLPAHYRYLILIPLSYLQFQKSRLDFFPTKE